VDDAGKVATQNRPPAGDGPGREKTFPLAFFDYSNVPIGALGRVPLRQWTARVEAADDPLLAAVNAGTDRTLTLILCATAVSIVGLLLAVRSLRTNFDLLALKSDFTAMVSHELKTPLAGITLIGDTLAKGHATSPETVTDYGSLILKEARRLGTLVENLLALSRVTDSGARYSMAIADIGALMNEALVRMRTQISEKDFRVAYYCQAGLPKVLADREAITHVFEILVDNAIRYSGARREVGIQVRHEGRDVKVSVKDHGSGIKPEDIPHVFERYFRGENAGAGGSGLGLAIANKVIGDHSGRITIKSTVGVGSEFTVVLPAAEPIAK
jgi:signal transduction histidine kinase